jgi:hypothetical protein
MNWSLSAGAGYLKSPEALEPDVAVRRYTASILHGVKLGSDGQSASALVWGANRSDHTSLAHSFLLENETILDAKNTIFGRAEIVQKTADDLVVGNNPATRFNVGALQLGYIRDFARLAWATVGLGATGTLNLVPRSLESFYGSRTPAGIFVFLRLRPFHVRASGGSTMKM